MIGGTLNVVISGIIFFFIIIEDSGSSLFYWDILNGIFFLQMCIKYLLGNKQMPTNGNNQNNLIPPPRMLYSNSGHISLHKHLYSAHGYYGGNRIMQISPGGLPVSQNVFLMTLSEISNFLFGNLDMTGDAVCQLMIIWLIVLLKRQGHALKNKYMLGNPATASVRHLVNYTVERPYINQTSHEQKKLMALLPKIMKSVEKDNPVKSSTTKMQHITAYIKTERIVNTMDIEYLRNIKKLCLLTRNEIYKIES